MNYVLYNAKSHNGNQVDTIEKFKELEATKKNVLDVNYDEFLPSLKEDDKVILVGGDGTLNHFVNDVDGKELPCKFYFYSAGTGNDGRQCLYLLGYQFVLGSARGSLSSRMPRRKSWSATRTKTKEVFS